MQTHKQKKQKLVSGKQGTQVKGHKHARSDTKAMAVVIEKGIEKRMAVIEKASNAADDPTPHEQRDHIMSLLMPEKPTTVPAHSQFGVTLQSTLCKAKPG